MLNLYVIEQCPYCRKVRAFLDENHINYNPILCPYPPEDQTNREKLMELGGKGQVPFLHDTEKDIKMYESDAIIEYVKKTNLKN